MNLLRNDWVLPDSVEALQASACISMSSLRSPLRNVNSQHTLE